MADMRPGGSGVPAEPGDVADGAVARAALPTVVVWVAPGRPFVVLYATVAVVALLSVTTMAAELAGVDFPLFGTTRGLFDVDAEASLPTWYQVVLLAAVAASAVTAAQLSRRTGQPALSWLLFAAAFAYLSLDDSTQLHERMSTPLRLRLGIDSGVLYFAWILVAAPMTLIFAVVMIRLLRRLPRRIAGLLILSGALFVAGAVGMELPGAVLYREDEPITLAYGVVATIEEVLEMLGITTALLALCMYIRTVGAPYGERTTAGPSRDAGAGDAGGVEPPTRAAQPSSVSPR